MRRSWVLAALLASCALDTTTGSDMIDPHDLNDPRAIGRQDGACTALEYHLFQSIEELDCSSPLDPSLKCRWDFRLTEQDSQHSRFDWNHSGIHESREVRCDGGRLSTGGPPPIYTGVYDPTSHQLFWQGNPYLLQ